MEAHNTAEEAVAIAYVTEKRRKLDESHTKAIVHSFRCDLCRILEELLQYLIQTVPDTDEHKLASIHRMLMQQLSEKEN